MPTIGFQGSFLQQLLHPAPSHPPARSAQAIEHLERMGPGRLSMHKDRDEPADGMLMGQELIWASAAAASPPEDPFDFTVIEVLGSNSVLHSERVLIKLIIFSSPPDFPQDTN